MKPTSRSRIGPGHTVFVAVILIAFAVARPTHAGNEPIHLVTDWSQRHVMFSAPHDSMDQDRLSRDPRYIQQLIRRDAERKDRHG